MSGYGFSTVLVRPRAHRLVAHVDGETNLRQCDTIRAFREAQDLCNETRSGKGPRAAANPVSVGARLYYAGYPENNLGWFAN